MMMVVGPHKYSRESRGFGAISFNTFKLFEVGEVILLPFSVYDTFV